MALGSELVDVLDKFVAVLLAVVEGVFGGSTTKLALCAGAVEIAGGARRIYACVLTHGVRGTSRAVAAVVALEITSLLNDDARVIEAVCNVGDADVEAYGFSVSRDTKL